MEYSGPVRVREVEAQLPYLVQLKEHQSGSVCNLSLH